MAAFVVTVACFACLCMGWFLASLAWASARADLESELMNLRARLHARREA